MKDNNVPPPARLPRRRQFFPMIVSLQREATTEVPSVRIGKAQTNDPRQENSGLTPIETMPLPLVKRPPSARRPAIRATRPMPLSRPAQPGQVPRPAGGVWRPGTFGFDDPEQDDDFKQAVTIPMLVLKDISNQRGQPAPTMQSEISGATGAAAMVGIGNVAGTVFRYGSNLMIQRGFGAGAYGLYSLCMSLVTLASSIFTLGLDNAMIRYISIYRSKKQSRSLIGLTIFCTGLVGVTGILGALLLMFLAPFIAAVKHDHHLVKLLEVMAPLVPLTCMQVVWFAGLQGFKAFKWRVIAQRLLPALVMILLVGAVLLFHHSSNPYNGIFDVALATIVSTGSGVLLSLYYLFRQVSRTADRGRERYELREWLVFSTPNFLSSIVDTVLVSTDTLFLAFFAISNIQIGYYTAAIKISAFISLPLVSLNAMFTPIIAELHAKEETQKLTSMFKLVTKWTITLSLPIFGVATLFSVSLLGISGGNFASAWPLLIALSVGNLFNAGTGSVGYMLLMTGHQKLSFLNSLVAVIFNVVFNIILTPRYGAMGTAISTGLAYTIVNMMRLLQVYVLLKIQPYRWDSLKPLGAGVISAGVTGILLYLFSDLHLAVHVGHGSLSLQIVLVPVFLAMYIGLVRLFKFSSEDKIVIDALRKKIKRRKK
ncbi:MAG TPA: oligosaccharide flippase family protein [Ktedonobacteraceae bacterium]|nr:oligosaccharide flippase family protein [Ktedonobacteraceae bacterium]